MCFNPDLDPDTSSSPIELGLETPHTPESHEKTDSDFGFEIKEEVSRSGVEDNTDAEFDTEMCAIKPEPDAGDGKLSDSEAVQN